MDNVHRVKKQQKEVERTEDKGSTHRSQGSTYRSQIKHDTYVIGPGWTFDINWQDSTKRREWAVQILWGSKVSHASETSTCRLTNRGVQDPDFRTRVRQDSAHFEQTGLDPDYGFILFFSGLDPDYGLFFNFPDQGFQISLFWDLTPKQS